MSASGVVGSAGQWEPEFPGQRPPFAPGNALARRSGAWSARVRDPLARELLAELADERPDVVERWPDLAADLCQVRARVHLLREWLVERGLFKGGDVRDGVLKHLRWSEQQALRLAAELGLTPAGEARLARDRAVAVDLSGVLAAGMATRDRRTEITGRTTAEITAGGDEDEVP